MRIVDRIEQWPTIRLKPYKRNARKHSSKQIDQIAESIRRFGFVNPILCSKEGDVIAGHGRLAAAQRLGLSSVPVIVLDYLSETERRALIIADNRTSELSQWDKDLLNVELAEIWSEFDLGFLDFELPALPQDEGGNVATLDDDSSEDWHQAPIPANDTSPSESKPKAEPPLDAARTPTPGLQYPVVVNLPKPVFEKLRRIARSMQMSPAECAARMIIADCDAQEE